MFVYCYLLTPTLTIFHPRRGVFFYLLNILEVNKVLKVQTLSM